MTLSRISAAAAGAQLAVFGTLSDGVPEGVATLVLLGPLEPGFWPTFTASAEYADGRADPLDRWSARVIGTLA